MPRVADADRKARPYAARLSPEERRTQLLDAALQIIVREGIHRVSMDSVAKEAGVTRPVIYGVFSNTNDLLTASLDREEQAVMEQLATIMPTVGEGKPGAAALQFLEDFLAAILAAPDRWRAVFTLVDSSTPEFRRRMERGRLAIVEVFEQLVRWAAIEDPDHDTDIELYARGLFALVWDAGRTVLAEPDRFPPERITTFARKVLKRLP